VSDLQELNELKSTSIQIQMDLHCDIHHRK